MTLSCSSRTPKRSSTKSRWASICTTYSGPWSRNARRIGIGMACRLPGCASSGGPRQQAERHADNGADEERTGDQRPGDGQRLGHDVGDRPARAVSEVPRSLERTLRRESATCAASNGRGPAWPGEEAACSRSQAVTCSGSRATSSGSSTASGSSWPSSSGACPGGQSTVVAATALSDSSSRDSSWEAATASSRRGS